MQLSIRDVLTSHIVKESSWNPCGGC